MPSTFCKTLATISRLKYFGHTMHNSECMEKILISGLTDGSGNKEDRLQDDQQKYEDP